MSDLPDLARMHAKRPVRSGRLIGLALLLFVGGYILWNCSGLSFPIWGARAKLERRLTQDLGFTLPASVTVERGSRVAYVDPSEAYLLRLPSDAVDPFITSLREAARKRGNDGELDDGPRFVAFGPIPRWFRPRDMPGLKELRIPIGTQPPSGYVVFFAPGQDKVYVFWYTT